MEGMEVSYGKVEKSQNRESVVERKLRLVEDPSSIVIAPKTREGHILAKILFGFDRGVGRLRMKTGTYIKIQDAIICFRQTETMIVRFNEFTSSLGDGKGVLGVPIYGEDPSTKLALAKRPTAYVIIPRSNEGKEVANLIKRLDPALLQFRNACTDFSKTEEIFLKLIGLISDFDILTDQISSLAGTSYDHPRDLGALRKEKDDQSPGEKERDPGPSNQGSEQKPTKSRKSGASS